MSRTPGLGLGCAVLLSLPGSAHAAGALNLTPDVPILVVNLVVFLLLIYPVNRLLLRPLVDVLREREARSLGAAERASEVVNETGRVRDQVDQKLADARAAAQARRTAILSEAQEREHALTSTARSAATSSVEEMRATLASELASARGSLRQDAETLAREAASRILDRSVA